VAGSETYELKILLSLQDRASQGLDKFEARLGRLGGAATKHAGVLGNLASLHDRVIAPLSRVGDVWRRQADSLSVYTDAYMKLARAQGKFQAINLSPAENARAFKAVEETVKNIQGISLADATTEIATLHTALGSLDHAIEALPLASKYQFSLKTLLGDQYSPEEVEKQTDAAFRFLEVTGKVSKGRDEMEKFFNVMVQMQTARAGKVSPTELFDFARMGSPAAQGLSVEGLRHMQSVLMELKGAGAGTALQASYRALVTGVMPQYAAEEFSRLGLVDKNKVQFGKAQKIKRILPGGNKLAEPFMRDPLEAADMLMGAMKTHGINTADDNAVRAELGRLFQKNTAFRMMSLLTTQRNQVLKESGMTEKSKDIGQAYDQALDSPMGKIEKFTAALENFRTKVGEPLVETGTKLVDSLTPVVKIFGEHPTAAKWAVAVLVGGKGLSALAETAAILKGSGLVGYFAGLSGEAGGAGASVGGLLTKLGTLSALGPIGLTIATVYTVSKIIEHVEAENAADEAQRGADSANSGNLKSLLKLRKHYAELGQPVPQDFYKSNAQTAWADISKRDKLVGNFGETDTIDYMGDAFKGSRTVNMLESVVRAASLQPQNPYTFGGRWSAPVAAADFQQHHQELSVPDVMREFLNLTKSKLKPDEFGMMAKTLEMAFPESYRQATQQTTQEIQNLSQQLAPTNQLFEQLQLKMLPVPDAFLSVGEASKTLTESIINSASRLNNASPTNPPPTGDQKEGATVIQGSLHGYVRPDRGVELIHAMYGGRPQRESGQYADSSLSARESRGGVHHHTHHHRYDIKINNASNLNPRQLARMIAEEKDRDEERGA
jgi:hypothetical protein